MKDKIISAAKEAFKKRLKNSSDVSANTNNAKEIATDWKVLCCALNPDRILHEVSIAPELDQRIDILDRTAMCAYEFKVSGKNATAEFYKDIVKVIMWNEKKYEKIKKLVFITESEWGRKYLDTPMPRTFIEYLKKHELIVEVEYLILG